MKRTKTLFLLFIFILSFFLQGQAYAKNMPMAKSPSDYSPQAGGLSSTVVVYMFKLNEDGSEQNVPISICQVGDLEPGCGVLDENTGTVSPYPPRDPYITFFVNCQDGHPK